MAKEFIYSKTREIGTIGKNTVEIGHYTVDGKEMPDKVYMVTKFSRKDGEHYVTSADHEMELCSGEKLKQKQKLRQEIIDAFNELY